MKRRVTYIPSAFEKPPPIEEDAQARTLAYPMATLAGAVARARAEGAKVRSVDEAVGFIRRSITGASALSESQVRSLAANLLALDERAVAEAKAAAPKPATAASGRRRVDVKDIE